MPTRHLTKLLPALALLTLGLWAAVGGRASSESAPSAPAPAAPADAGAATAPDVEEPPGDLDGLFELGRSLFDTYAPEEVKAQFRFPTRDEWEQFSARLQHTMESGSLEEIVAYKPEVQATLTALRTWPEYQHYADWLAERLDYIEVAEKATQAPTPLPAGDPEPIPYYDLWFERLKNRPAPAAADDYVEELEQIFADAGLPPALVWLAEVESTFNPEARSPVGARGLFQIMPATATELGLSLSPIDERTHPRKSAEAAARFLAQLHRRFDSWPLALAAYNAGPGRVSRTLRARSASTFGDIAPALPAETRMYVPKVLATLAVRAGVTPGRLATEPGAARLDRRRDGRLVYFEETPASRRR